LAGGVRSGHGDAEGGADIGRGDDIARTRYAGDCSAVRSARVAPPPLVGKGNRCRPRPGACCCRECRAVDRLPGYRRRRGVRRRRSNGRLDVKARRFGGSGLATGKRQGGMAPER
jgi:hypothetical protein